MGYGNKIVIIAGPNGAGKTTFFYQNKLVGNYIFVNADEIAREVSLTQINKNTDVRIIAGKEVIHTIDRYLENNTNFALETTLSGNFPIKIINKALVAGYEIELNYIGIDSPEDSVKRVEHRVREGGHNVPSPDILRRYYRSLENILKAVGLVQVAQIYDNSKQKHDLLLRLEKGIVTNIYSEKFPFWFKNAVDIDSLSVGNKLIAKSIER